MIKNLSNILYANCILQLFSISIVHTRVFWRNRTTRIGDVCYVLDVVIRSQLSGVLSTRLFSHSHGASDMQSNGGLRFGILTSHTRARLRGAGFCCEITRYHLWRCRYCWFFPDMIEHAPPDRIFMSKRHQADGCYGPLMVIYDFYEIFTMSRPVRSLKSR